MIYHEPRIKIYFGEKEDQLYQDEYRKLTDTHQLLEHASFARLKPLMGLENLIFLRQTHSIHGLTVGNNAKSFSSFLHEGDFLITQERGIGIGVMTADCAPLLLYDMKNHAIGAVHAGWRGTVNQILAHALQAMHTAFKTDPEHLRVYCGPMARSCCYEVTPDFLSHLHHFSFADQLIQKRGEKLFFDSLLCNRLQLQALGVASENISLRYAHCTIENDSFFSHRRSPADSGRQMSVIALQ